MGAAFLTQRNDGEAVDLADALAVGIDQQLAAQDFVAVMLGQPLIAPPPCLPRRLDMRAGNGAGTRRRRKMVGLVQQVAEAARLGGQTLGIA